MDLAPRLAALEALAAEKGIDIDTDIKAVERRIRAVKARLYERQAEQ